MKYLLMLFLSLSLFAEEKHSLLLKNNSSPYFKYITELIEEKKMSKEHIINLLNSNKRTLTTNMLKGLDLDFNKKDLASAMFYYEELINKIPDKVKNTIESFYLSDYLLRVNKYDKIKDILDINYCESLINMERKDMCFYYLYLGTKNPILLEKIENKEYRMLL